MKDRISKHFKLNSKISSLSDKDIHDLLKNNKVGDGWGTNHNVKVAGNKVFVKSVPVTDLELKNNFDTKNNYNMPMYYNYGVGSAGFGVFRELNLHIKTTNWVLSGKFESFPLMYHYRILKKKNSPKKLSLKKIKAHNSYIKYWNNSKRIDRYILDRKQSEYEVVIFLEYIPYVLRDWMKPNINRINEVSKKIFKIIEFLKSNGIIHFDTHFGNTLTDGKNIYLTDFGLGLDKKFNLNSKEITFYKQHRNYDYMLSIGAFSDILESSWHDLSLDSKKMLEERYGIRKETSHFDKVNLLLINLDDVKKLMKLSNSYVKFIEKHKSIIVLRNDFLQGMRRDNKKREIYPAGKLNRELRKSKTI